MQYAKTFDKKWLLTEHQSADEILHLDRIECKMQFSEIYFLVDFAEVEE